MINKIRYAFYFLLCVKKTFLSYILKIINQNGIILQEQMFCISMRKVEDINVFYKKKPLYVPQGLKKLDKPKIKKRRKTNVNDSIYNESTLLKEHVVEYTNYPNNVLFFDKETKTIHPTQKPVDLLAYLIKTYTKENYIVLDN